MGKDKVARPGSVSPSLIRGPEGSALAGKFTSEGVFRVRLWKILERPFRPRERTGPISHSSRAFSAWASQYSYGLSGLERAALAGVPCARRSVGADVSSRLTKAVSSHAHSHMAAGPRSSAGLFSTRQAAWQKRCQATRTPTWPRAAPRRPLLDASSRLTKAVSSHAHSHMGCRPVTRRPTIERRPEPEPPSPTLPPIRGEKWLAFDRL